MSLLLAALVVGSGGPGSQRQPDFSGTWTLVDFRSASDPASAERGAEGQSGVVGGAVLNCGRECTITQTPGTLTVSQPAGQDGTKPRDGAVYLDGRPMSGKTTLKWDGTKLVLTRTIAEPLVVTQTLSLEEERLIIVVAMSAGKAGPFTLTYKRK
jgi:hypothetical protein